MHSITTRRALLATTLMLLAAGGSSFAQQSNMTIQLSGSHQNGDVLVGSIGLVREAASGTISGSHSPDYGYHGGLSASASPGRVSARAGSYASYSGPAPQPYSLSTYSAGANAQFYDYLTITGRHGAVVPDSLRIRITWRTTGGYLYEDPDSNWGGLGSYSVSNTSHLIWGQKGRGQYGPPISTDGTPSGNMIFTEESTTPATGYMLNATVYAQASNGPYTDQDAGGGNARASGHCSMEVLGIEVLDDTTGALLAVNVTGASGHVYPVVQPPLPWMPGLHVTAYHISREGGAVMLSFASEAGVSYRVLGSLDMGQTLPWQELHTLTGSSGVSIATFADPAATTDAFRFYKVERVTP